MAIGVGDRLPEGTFTQIVRAFAEETDASLAHVQPRAHAVAVFGR